MADDIDLGKLSDRELLILAVQGVNTHGKRLDAHARDIKELRAWRFYLGGGIAALAAALGLRGSH